MRPGGYAGRTGRALAAGGCAAPQGPAKRGQPPQASGFQLQNFGKTDLDMVAELHVRESLATLRLLTVKLYKRNPREWRRGGQPSLEAAVARIFDTDTPWSFPELGGKQGTDAIHLAFREDFQGDRVLAFMGGLARMVLAAVMAERSGRTVVKVVLNLATGIFLPIPIPASR